mgnify:CR=1 FL=1
MSVSVSVYVYVCSQAYVLFYQREDSEAALMRQNMLQEWREKVKYELPACMSVFLSLAVCVCVCVCMYACMCV